jgi:hypothetical protein
LLGPAAGLWHPTSASTDDKTIAQRVIARVRQLVRNSNKDDLTKAAPDLRFPSAPH